MRYADFPQGVLDGGMPLVVYADENQTRGSGRIFSEPVGWKLQLSFNLAFDFQKHFTLEMRRAFARLQAIK
jgi:hypothetical protein